MSKSKRGLALLLCLVMVFSLLTVIPFTAVDTDASAANNTGWISTWHESMLNLNAGRIEDSQYGTAISLSTLFSSAASYRIQLPITVGGQDFQVTLTNYYGSEDIVVNGMSVGKQGSGTLNSMDASTEVPVNGGKGFTIPVGGEKTVSFRMKEAISAGTSLVFNVYVKNFAKVKDAALTGGSAWAVSGDTRGDATMSAIGNIKNLTQADPNVGNYNIIPMIHNVDVHTNDAEAYTTVVIGDSTVTNDIPSNIYNKLVANGVRNVSVVSSAIKGNEELQDGAGHNEGPLEGDAMVYKKADGSFELGRYAKDALEVSGVQKIFIKIGANDIVHPYCSNLKEYYNGSSSRPNGYIATAQDMIDGYKFMVAEAHKLGIEVYFFDITPFYGYTRESTVTIDTNMESNRLAVNYWLSQNCSVDENGNAKDINTAEGSKTFGYIPLSEELGTDILSISLKHPATGETVYMQQLKNGPENSSDADYTTDYIHYTAQGQSKATGLVPITIFKNVVFEEEVGHDQVKNLFVATTAAPTSGNWFIASDAGNSASGDQQSTVYLCSRDLNKTTTIVAHDGTTVTKDTQIDTDENGQYKFEEKHTFITTWYTWENPGVGGYYDHAHNELTAVEETMQRGTSANPYIAINPANLKDDNGTVTGSETYKAAYWTKEGSGTSTFWKENSKNPRYLSWYFCNPIGASGSLVGTVSEFDTGMRTSKPKMSMVDGGLNLSEWYTFNTIATNGVGASSPYLFQLYFAAATGASGDKYLSWSGPISNNKYATQGMHFRTFNTDSAEGYKHPGVAFLRPVDAITTRLEFTSKDWVFFNGEKGKHAPVRFELGDTLENNTNASENTTVVEVNGNSANDLTSKDYKFNGYTYGQNRTLTVKSSDKSIADFDSNDFVVKLGGEYGTATLTWTFEWDELDGTHHSMTGSTKVTNVKYDCDIEVTSGTNQFPDEYTFETNSTANSINVTAIANSVIPDGYTLPSTAVWTWSSDNTAAVAVSGNGQNATISRSNENEGVATIMAICTDSATGRELCRSSIDVTNLLNKINIAYGGNIVDDVDVAYANNNNTISLEALSANGALPTGGTWTWISSNESVASVSGNSQKATVTANNVGNAVITAFYTYKLSNGTEITLTDTINIHITALQKVSAVISFGLPISIDMADGYMAKGQSLAGVGNALPEGVKLVDGISGTVDKNTYSDKTDTDFGKASVNGNILKYELKSIISEMDTVYYSVSNNSDIKVGPYQYSEVNIIPATDIYYEDSFVTFSDGWTTVGETKNVTGSANSDVYGYDDAYGEFTTYSLGSARMATVAKGGEVKSATFTFTGTGFEIYSACSNSQGGAVIAIYEGTEVDSSKQQGMMTITSTRSEGNYYQTPVVCKDLDYGTYTVEIKVAYSSILDPGTDKLGSVSFIVDGVRIYNSKLNETYGDVYAADGEYNANIQSVRSILLSKNDFGTAGEVQGAVFVDSYWDGEANVQYYLNSTVADYKNYGPKNEVYLAKGQAVAFTISDMSGVADVQLGIKSVQGDTAVKVKVNDKVIEVTSATDMYYSILEAIGTNGNVVIANDGDAVVSITNLKITHEKAAAAAAYAMVTPETGTFAVKRMAMLMAAPVVDPDPTTEPSTEPTVDPTDEPSTEPTTEPTDTPDPEPTQTPDPDNGDNGDNGDDDDHNSGNAILKLIQKAINTIKTVFGKLFGGKK